MNNFHSSVSSSSTILGFDAEYQGPNISQPRKRARPHKINYPKKRVSVACEICRSRKTRCDAAKPTCSFCADIGAQCVYRRLESEERYVSWPCKVPDLYVILLKKGSTEPDSCLRAVEPRPPTNTDYEEHEIITRLKRIEELLQQSDQQKSPINHENICSPEVLETAGITPDGTHSSLLVIKPSYYSHRPMTVGINLSGLSRLLNRPGPDVLAPLCHDDFEEQLELHFIDGERIFQQGPTDLSTLNLSSRRCWQLQQMFTKDVLPWCPIIDQQALTELVNRTVDAKFPYNLDTCLTLFVLALGSFAQDSHHLNDDPNMFPGIDYFRAGCMLLDADRGAANTILYTQCHIFMALYLLYSLRPIQAFETIRRASQKIIMLLQLRSRLAADPAYREMCHRAFWACYLIEHELQGYVPFSALLLQVLHDEVPLPTSDYDEPGIYWFLSEIAIRRIFTRPRHGIGWNMHILYEPVIADEIASQMSQWQANLPHPVKWPLEDSVHMRSLLDPQKVFLRAQYYAVTSVLFWQYVVRLLTGPNPTRKNPPDASTEREHTRIRDAAAKSLRYAVIHVYAVESLFQSRHVMLMANFNGLYTMTMVLLCTYDVRELESIQPPQRKEAILLAWRSLKNLEANPPIKKKIERIEELMRVNGIETF